MFVQLIDRFIQFLSRDTVQRVLYAIALVIFTLFFWEKLNSEPDDLTIYGVSFTVLYWIVFSLLAVQIVRNNRVFWLVILLLFTTNAFGSFFYSVILSIRHVDGFNLLDMAILLFFFSVFLGSSWILYHIKPKRVF